MFSVLYIDFLPKIQKNNTMRKSTTLQQQAVEVLAYMQELFGDFPLTELYYKTPFQLLVAVIMSAQTTDKQVNKVNELFFQHVKRPEDIIALGESWVGEMIRTVGLWKSKTVNLVKMAHMIVGSNTIRHSKHEGTEKVYSASTQTDIRDQQRQYPDKQTLYHDWWYRIPDTLDDMIKLPWVGIKTAKVVLYILYGQRWVAVDTHVHRVMNRLGIVATKTPEQTSVLLEQIIPDNRKDIAHRVIIYFGRYWCMAKHPKCSDCKLMKTCIRYNQMQKKKL